MQAATVVDPEKKSGFPPGPPPRRGIARNLRYFAGFALDPIGFVRERFETFGDLYYAPNPTGGLYVVKHPDHVREVLSTRASSYGKKHTAFDQLSRVLGEGLLLSDGDVWMRHRRMMQPAFAPARMAGYAEAMVDEARRTADAWEGGGEIRMDREMTSLTLRVVSRTLFGHGVSDADIASVGDAMHAFQRQLSSPDLAPAWMPLPSRRRFARALEDLDSIVYRIIGERRGQSAEAAGGRKDLLQVLVDAVDEEGKGGKLTERELRDELVTLYLAGHETTSQALTWTFYCLSRWPQAERALHAELDAVLAGRPPSYADLEHLPYTEQVISEAMRLYPPVYAVARRADEDTELGGWRVPRGSEVMVWIYMTHHDPRFYPDPLEFRPERFEKERAAALPKFAYLPFGAGPRACIGRGFALVEARLLLATLSQRYRLTLSPGQKVVERPRITLTPKDSVRMKPTKR